MAGFFLMRRKSFQFYTICMLVISNFVSVILFSGNFLFTRFNSGSTILCLCQGESTAWVQVTIAHFSPYFTFFSCVAVSSFSFFAAAASGGCGAERGRLFRFWENGRTERRAFEAWEEEEEEVPKQFQTDLWKDNCFLRERKSTTRTMLPKDNLARFLVGAAIVIAASVRETGKSFRSSLSNRLERESRHMDHMADDNNLVVQFPRLHYSLPAFAIWCLSRGDRGYFETGRKHMERDRETERDKILCRDENGIKTTKVFRQRLAEIVSRALLSVSTHAF